MGVINLFIEKLSFNTIVYIYILGMSIISFILMGIDKKRAIKHKWRIKESTLLFFALIGGAIGTLISMKVFHHKTKNIKFKIGVPIICMINILLAIILLE